MQTPGEISKGNEMMVRMGSSCGENIPCSSVLSVLISQFYHWGFTEWDTPLHR